MFALLRFWKCARDVLAKMFPLPPIGNGWSRRSIGVHCQKHNKTKLRMWYDCTNCLTESNEWAKLMGFTACATPSREWADARGFTGDVSPPGPGTDNGEWARQEEERWFHVFHVVPPIDWYHPERNPTCSDGSHTRDIVRVPKRRNPNLTNSGRVRQVRALVRA